MMAKFSTIIVFIPFLLLPLSCSNKKMVYPEPSAEGKDGSFITTLGTFKFGDGELSADYGTITVSENREDTVSRLLHLPVIRIHARTNNSNPPIFCLAGGPGQSNMNWSPTDSLLYDHDFVMVGYRGVDGSAVLDCPEVVNALKNCGEDLLSEESLKNLAKAWKVSADHIKSQGIDIDGYTIPEVIEDLEAVRKAFKYERINLLSESYGTRIAYIYGLVHPQKIYRSIMIAANPPGKFIWDPQVFDKKLRYYSRLWANDSLMQMESEDLTRTIVQVLNHMPRKWLFFSINPGKVKVTTQALLAHRKTAAQVFNAFIAAEKGDYTGLVMMSLAFDYTFPSMMVFGDCAAKAGSADLNYFRKITITDNAQSRILGAPLNELLWKPLSYEDFPIKMIPDSLQSLRESNVETLIISGSIDFSTPVENVKELLPYLKNGKHIILSEFGHVGDLRFLRKSMTDQIITDFFNKGIVDESKIEYVPMDFQVSWGFPLIFKVAIVTIIIIVAFLIVVSVWLIKKVRRKRMQKSFMVGE
jgi:pimeloyl-ACP methyl ester carboxylesterase